MNSSQFVIENGIAEIDLEILEQVAEEKDFQNRKSETFPVEAHELYKRVIDIVSNSNGATVQVEKILVPERSIKIVGHKDKTTEAPLDRHRLLSHVGAIRLPTKSDKDKSMAVAISCSQKGIQIAYGTRIFVCHNQCIFGDKLMQTFGPNKVDYNKMMEVLENYTTNFSKHRKAELELIAAMQSTLINSESFISMVGDLYMRGRAGLNAESSYRNSMNVSDIGKVLDALGTVHTYDSLLKGENEISVWDMYDTITNVLNPRAGSDLITVYNQNSAVSNYLLERYGLHGLLPSAN